MKQIFITNVFDKRYKEHSHLNAMRVKLPSGDNRVRIGLSCGLIGLAVFYQGGGGACTCDRPASKKKARQKNQKKNDIVEQRGRGGFLCVYSRPSVYATGTRIHKHLL